MSNEDLAFEYVLGTLRGLEREEFQAALQRDEQLQSRVRFWENQLIAMNDENAELKPLDSTWQAIEKKINPVSETTESARPLFQSWLQSWLPWSLSAVFSVLLVALLTFADINFDSTQHPPVDYVAVLTSDTGDAKLTALTESESKTLWLQWGEVELNKEENLQIWALSRSDGQIRSIAVVQDTEGQQIQLTDAYWRLIKDAESLILTVEEEGGSAIDEPSDTVVAKGLCIRVT